jgi:hypothetical protein
MKERLPGEMTTLETRGEAHEEVDKNKRYKQILAILDGHEMTAKEIANEMCIRGYVPTNERNYASPRLTELSVKGIVEPIGSKVCRWTGKRVAVYAIRRD